MNKHIRYALLPAFLLVTAACARQHPAADPVSGPLAEAGRRIEQASVEVRDRLERGNITLSARDGNAPKAEITPHGELLIDGRQVATTPEQKDLLLEYRAGVAAVAQAGADIGLQGAGLALKAVGAATRAVFSGAGDAEIERAMESEAGKVKASAAQLCDRLPALFETQQRLAASLPEFAPYARMDREDVTGCRDEVASH